jgi:two-component system, LytTR family, response regulator
VTAYDEFALPAFDVDAVDYLTKPLVEDRFDAALGRVRDRLAGRRVYASHLTTRVGNRDVIIPLDGVEYIQADDVYAVVNANGRRYLVRSSLDALERALDPTRFARVHRSYIVRVDRVRDVRRDETGGAELSTMSGVRIPVSRRRRAVIDKIIRPLAT